MKNLKKYLAGILMFSSLFFFGCEEDLTYNHDTTPPSPPTNVRVYNGDNLVDIVWNYNSEGDVAGYNVYYNYSYQGQYTLIGSTQNNFFTDGDAINGETYYYAVSAYDYNGNESELSYDVVYATPRPEGYNQAVFDYLAYPSTSGYSFGDYLVVPYNDDNSDFFFENYNGTFYLNVWDDTDIQDMGTTTDIYDVAEAPVSGWVPLQQGENVKYVQAQVGHTYVIWTWDNHFAKIRVSRITDQRMVFDWVYQTVEGNPMLKMKNIPSERKLNSPEVKKNRK